MNFDRRHLLGTAAVLAAWPAVVAQTRPERGDATASLEASGHVLRRRVPEHFLSFNLNSITLELQFWDDTRNSLRQDMVQEMTAFPGAIYRYPGGLIANTFNWEWAVGPKASRRPQKGTVWSAAAPVRFGPQAYFDFLRAVGGRSWYTLNLLGWSADKLHTELDASEVAASNGRLARFRAENDPTRDFPHYYQFGNELDRSQYEWPTEKYIARARDSMARVLEADPAARFVPFLRDFDWNYRNRPGRSKADDFAMRVLEAMPEVDDYSLQIYYDRPSEEGQSFDIPWRLRLIDKIMTRAQRVRDKPLRVWITEHAKAKPAKVASPDLRLASTSGITGAIASADFCLAMLERPAVQATLWHALGGAAWWDLFRVEGGKLEPTPVYQVFRLLREQLGGDLVGVSAGSSNVGRYPGGYDLRAALMRMADRSTALIVNRAPVPGEIALREPLLANQTIEVQMESIAASRPGDRLEDEMAVSHLQPAPTGSKTGADGRLSLVVPARSVSVARLLRRAG